MGESEDANGDGLRLFTSPGATSQPELIELTDALASFEALRTKGPIEQTLVSPLAEAPIELGEEVVESVNNETRRRVLNVFLPDSRVDVDNTKYPYRTVGIFGGCTATLVYDQGIMVTNSHCLNYFADGSFDPSTWDKTFYAGFKNGFYMQASKPKAIWYNKYYDYAVIKLWSNIDSVVGRMGVYWRDIGYFSVNRPLKMISYSGDHCMSWNNCKPKMSSGSSRGTINSRDVKHDLDGKRGSSGSAMFAYYSGWPVMEALNWGEYRNGGEVSLTLASYTGSNPNVAKPAGVWKFGYDQVKNF
jgi:V8-like Glu-specific endopeptidase